MADFHIFAFRKLVRDKVVADTRSEGCIPTFKTLEGVALQQALLHKVQEELDEVTAAFDNPDEFLKELADLSTAIDALATARGISPAELAAARVRKEARKGGFSQGIFVETMAIPVDHPEIEDFLSQPDKFPLLETRPLEAA